MAAHLLHRTQDVTVFEAHDRVRGHVCTIDVTAPDGARHAVDMGFIVYNEQRYPLCTELCCVTLNATGSPG